MVHIKTFFAIFVLSFCLAADDIDVLIEKVSAYNFGQDPTALRELEAAVFKTAGSRDAAALEKRLIAGLGSAKAPAASDAFCRYLSVIGTDASVPALAQMLQRTETAEMARYALERIPGSASSEALRKTLGSASAQAKAGIVVSLGRRKDAASVGVIKPLLESGDRALAEAAASALADIGNTDAREALLAAKPSGGVPDALLKLAARSSGAQEILIYQRLNGSPNDAVRMAALKGLARVQGKQSVPALTAAMKSGSRPVQAVAIRELAGIEGVGLARHLSELPPDARVGVLAALADLGKPDVVPFLEQGLASDSEAVRIASLNGLAKLGTAKQIPALAARAASASGDEQAAARAALGSIRGTEADGAVLKSITSAEPKVKVELIRAAGDRGIRSAPGILLTTAADPDSKVRAESIRALRDTAGPAHVSQLVALLVKTDDDNDRKEFERTVAAAIRRSKDAPVGELAAAYQRAGDPGVRSSLLAVMAAVGNDDALGIIREGVKSGDADVQRSAIAALSSWPTAAPMDDLLGLAKSSSSQAQQVLALRGYVKLVQIPSDRPPAETAKLLAAGMSAARRADEKKLVIAAAQRVVCSESLELVKASLSDPDVANEARLAVTALERGLSFRRN